MQNTAPKCVSAGKCVCRRAAYSHIFGWRPAPTMELRTAPSLGHLKDVRLLDVGVCFSLSEKKEKPPARFRSISP